MAHVEKRRRTRDDGTTGTSWRARYVDPAGHERSRTFGRRVDADRYISMIESDKLRGQWVDPMAGRVAFGDYLDQWRRVQVHRPTTRAHVETMLRRHAVPVLGSLPMAAVRPSQVQAWVRGLSDVLAPATVQVVYRYVAAVFRAAVADRLIPSSPCVGVKLPRPVPRQVVPLETSAVHALVEAVPGRYAALVLLAAGTGLRQGECFGLEVRHVDFLRRLVTVEQQLVLLPGAPPQVAPPKTDASYRTVPLPHLVVAALAAHLAAFPAGPAGLVFTSAEGLPIRRTRFSEGVWRPSVARAGLPAGTHFHDLRHYYASLLIRHGESVKVVQSRLGHASASETLDTYSHLWPDSEDQTRAAVDSVLGAATAPARPGEIAET